MPFLADSDEKISLLNAFAVENCPQWNIFITVNVGNDSTANGRVFF